MSQSATWVWLPVLKPTQEVRELELLAVPDRMMYVYGSVTLADCPLKAVRRMAGNLQFCPRQVEAVRLCR